MTFSRRRPRRIQTRTRRMGFDPPSRSARADLPLSSCPGRLQDQRLRLPLLPLSGRRQAIGRALFLLLHLPSARPVPAALPSGDQGARGSEAALSPLFRLPGGGVRQPDDAGLSGRVSRRRPGRTAEGSMERAGPLDGVVCRREESEPPGGARFPRGGAARGGAPGGTGLCLCPEPREHRAADALGDLRGVPWLAARSTA